MSNEVYAITNLNGYATDMRDAAAKSICESYNENLDEYISINQMINLIQENCIGFDDCDRPILNEDANEIIYKSAMVWIENVGLAKLAAKGYVECSWDDKINNMVFWTKEQTNTIVDKTGESNDKPIKRRNNKKNKGS